MANEQGTAQNQIVTKLAKCGVAGMKWLYKFDGQSALENAAMEGESPVDISTNYNQYPHSGWRVAFLGKGARIGW